jgi:hypothetical protein
VGACQLCRISRTGNATANITFVRGSRALSQFIDPDLEKRTIGKKGGAKKGGTAIDDSAIWAQMDPTEAAKMRSIKEMKQKGMPATLTRKPSVTFGGAGGGGGDGGGTSTEALIDAGKRCHGCSRHLYIGSVTHFPVLLVVVVVVVVVWVGGWVWVWCVCGVCVCMTRP